MKTIQGKEFNYGDILLYKVREEKGNKVILTMINDRDQLSKFNFTKDAKDAPIGIFPYTALLEHETLTNMKQIKKCELNGEKASVTYEDGTKSTFTGSNIETINNIMQKQKELKKEVVIGEWDQENHKKQAQRKLNRWLAGALATVALGGTLFAASKSTSCNAKTNNLAYTTSNDKNYSSIATPEPIEVGPESIPAISYKESLEYGKKLHQETLSKNAYILKYQQVANIKWNETLATEVVELINGVYPQELINLDENTKEIEMAKILEAINLLVAGNLGTETEKNNIIDLTQYIKNENDKKAYNEAMIYGRSIIDNTLYQPSNGAIIESDEYINKFSKNYLNNVDCLLNHEFEVMNSPVFLEMNAGCKYLTIVTYQSVNATIPQWSYITRKSSERDTREYTLYYRYFQDDVEKKLYTPYAGKNGTTMYECVYEDEKGICKKETYTEDVMYAMAGLSTVEEQRNLNIEANPNIHKFGIEVEFDTRLSDALETIYQAEDTFKVGDATLSIKK